MSRVTMSVPAILAFVPVALVVVSLALQVVALAGGGPLPMTPCDPGDGGC